MSGWTALVLAGERPGRPDPVALAEGVAHKALVEVGGRTLLARVADALSAAGAARIVVSTRTAAVERAARALGAEVRPATEGGPSLSVLEAARALGAPLLVTTADHALLRPEWVRRFLADAPEEADVCALLARRKTVEAAAPGSRRTYLRLADGSWSGCNLFALRAERGVRAVEFWRRLEAQRKRPWRMAGLLGPGVLARYALGRLTLEDAVARLGRRAEVRAAAVPCPFGLAAVDVDTPEDLRFARELESGDRPAPA